MNEAMNDGSLKKFFKFMCVACTFSALTTDLSNMSMIDIVNRLFLTFMYNFIVGIWGGMAWMFGSDLYLFLKKNTKNEQSWI